MNSGLLTLYFSETVDITTFDITGVSLQLASEVVADQLHMIEMANLVTPDDSPTPMLIISNDDLNVLKTRNIALSETSTYAMTNTTVADIVGKNFIPLQGVMVKSVNTYTTDSNSPQLLIFTLDMDNGYLTLSFDETIDGSTQWWMICFLH